MIECTHLSRDEKIRQKDSVSVVLFMQTSVLLAAYARWGVVCLHDPCQQWQLIKGLKCLCFTQ